MPRQVARKTGVASGTPASACIAASPKADVPSRNPGRRASWQQMAAGQQAEEQALDDQPHGRRGTQIIFTIIMKKVSVGRPIIDVDACQPTTVLTMIPHIESSREATAAAAIRGLAT